jgi:hypothetical protein
MTSEREKQLEDVLVQFLKPIKGIPFEVVIKSLCGTIVEPFDTETAGNKSLLTRLTLAIREACLSVQQSPIKRPRPNEVGNDMEPFVIAALLNQGFDAGSPKSRDGKGKSTGYPDIKINGSELPIYLEVKSYATAKNQTTLRSFYLSPSENPKVSDDGHHLLVGFEMLQNAGQYTPVAFELVDLYGLSCDMKAEFNSDNKRLYQNERVLVRERL